MKLVLQAKIKLKDIQNSDDDNSNTDRRNLNQDFRKQVWQRD